MESLPVLGHHGQAGRRFFFPFPLAVFLSTLLSGVPVSAQAGKPPVAETSPHTTTIHGQKLEDAYHWLRDRDNPKVISYLEAENAHTEATLAPVKSLQDKLAEEIKARVIEEDVSVPYKKGDWLYYSRDLPGKEHAALCRKPYPDGAETILLDLNERAGDSNAYSFGSGVVSPDGTLYAWKENLDGTDRFTIRFKDLTKGEILPDVIPDTAFAEAPVWAQDNKTLFYTEPDATERSWRVKKHTLGTPTKEDTPLYEEPDTQFQVSLGETRSGAFLLISSTNSDTTETSLVPLNSPGSKPVVFCPRKTDVRYAVTDCDGFWYIVSSEDAINGRIFRVPIANHRREDWSEIIPHDEQITYSSIDSFRSHIVIGARKNGVPGLFLLNADDPKPRWIEAPAQGSSLYLESTPDFDSSFQRISYESFLQPYIVADLDLKSGDIKPVKQKASPPGYDSTRYRVERTEATAPDGERIPIWLVLPKNHKADGSTPILLDGYGAYGSSNDPWFNISLFSLLDRGIGFAIAQVRGGGELGRRWYEEGKLKHKSNTFTDFIACAEHLIAQKYTSSGKLCAYGGSAGGLLIGAVINQRPNLFRAVIADVPFVDTLNTMLDPTLPLTTGEYTEWGNPTDDLDAFNRIRSYSPYDNLKPQSYPAILALTGLNDTRVAYWEPAKWVARLRTVNTSENPILLETELDTGHGGASGRYSYFDRVALQYAFLMMVLGTSS